MAKKTKKATGKKKSTTKKATRTSSGNTASKKRKIAKKKTATKKTATTKSKKAGAKKSSSSRRKPDKKKKPIKKSQTKAKKKATKVTSKKKRATKKKVVVRRKRVATKKKRPVLSNDQALKFAEHQLKKAGLVDFDITEIAKAKRSTLKELGIKKPSAKALEVESTTTEKKGFAGESTAFGNTVKTFSVVKENQNDLNLQVAKDGFTFDAIFKNFNAPNNDLFVFDNVNIHLRQQFDDDTSKHTMRFNGDLRMDKEPLKTLKKFLKCEDGLRVAGVIDTQVTDISEKIAPSRVELYSAGKFLVPLIDGVVLKEAEIKIVLEKVQHKWKFTNTIEANLELNKLGEQGVELVATVKHTNNNLSVHATAESAQGLFNIDQLNLANIEVSFNVGKENDIDFSGDFIPGRTTYRLAGKVSKKFSGIYASASIFTLDDLNTMFKYLNNDTLSLPTFDMTFKDVYIGFATADGSIDGHSLQEGFSIGGSIAVHGHTVRAFTHFSKNGVAFIGDIDKLSVGPVDISKTKLAVNLYAARNNKKASFSLGGSAIIENLKLDCKVTYEKQTDGSSNTMLYAAINANSFSMASVFPAARNTFIDSLKFSQAVFIYSSSDAQTQDSDYNFSVKKGLTLAAILEDVPALDSLTKQPNQGLVLSAHFGSSTNIGIEIPDTRLNLGNSVICDVIRLGIQITPQPKLQMLFGMEVIVPKQDNTLHFDLMLEIGLIEARGSATMKGYWVDPFGVKGLQIGPELALQLGIIYSTFAATGLPSEFGFAGGIVLGEVSGKMAANISQNPMNQILMGEVEHLSPKNLVAFAETVTSISIDKKAVPNFFDIEQLKLYCAPAGGNIGTIRFEPGFSFIANLVLFDKKINIYTLFNDEGVIAKGEIDKIEIGPLKISGTNGGNAKLDLELTSVRQAVYLDCAVSLFGLSYGIHVDISNQGATFMLEQKFLDLFRYKIIAKTKGSFSDPKNLDFLLYAEFETSITEYLKTTVVAKINDAKSAVDVSINEAKREVAKAKKAYMAEFEPAQKELARAQKEAEKYLKKAEADVRNEKAKWNKTIRNAQADVNKAKTDMNRAITTAQKKVNKAQSDYNRAMRNAQNKVARERSKYNSNLNKARRDANKAINDYNRAFADVNSAFKSAQRTVNSLQGTINSYERQIKRLTGIFDQPKRAWVAGKLAATWTSMKAAKLVLKGARAAVNAFKKSSVAVAKTSTQAALRAAQTTGALALRAAESTLEATRHGGGYIAIQSATQALNVARSSGQIALRTAQGSLRIAQTSGRSMLTAAEFTLNNVGNSAVFIAMEAAEASLEAVKVGSAAAAFESAKGVLEGAKQGTNGMLSVAAYMASHVGDIVDVKKVTLAASLKNIQKGKLFVATFDGAVFGKSYKTIINFDVNNAGEFVEDVFKDVLSEAKKIAS